MKYQRMSLLFCLLLLTGCAAYKPPPLTTNHPAHPDAAAVPEPPVSNTLVYTRSDIPSPHPMTAMVAPERGREARQPAPDGQQTVVGEGKVIATVPNASQIVVEHGEIKGFMEAMTMGYRVEPPALLGGIRSGDWVRFTIDVAKKAIVKLEKVAASVATTSPQEGEGYRGAEADPQQTVVGEGKVIATVPNAGQIVVEHGEIKGFMEAMTMGYRVEPPALLGGLKSGDEVRFTIDVPKKAIVKIEKLK